MATKTGNSYTTGATTDSVEIPTVSPAFSTVMASPNKASPSDTSALSANLGNDRVPVPIHAPAAAGAWMGTGTRYPKHKLVKLFRISNALVWPGIATLWYSSVLNVRDAVFAAGNMHNGALITAGHAANTDYTRLVARYAE